MSERKWTPGPWKWADDRGKTGLIYLTGVLIAEHTDGTPWGDDIDRANAHLIAAAPELYEALEKCIKEYEMVAHSEFDGVWSKEDFEKEFAPFYAALAKARGEQ